MRSNIFPIKPKDANASSESSSFQNSSLIISRRRLRFLTAVGISLGTLILLYSVWMIGRALLENGVTRNDMLAFGILYVWAAAIPIELIVSAALYRKLRAFKEKRTCFGINNREPVERIALLSIILCLIPFAVTSIALLFAIIFTFIL